MTRSERRTKRAARLRRAFLTFMLLIVALSVSGYMWSLALEHDFQPTRPFRRQVLREAPKDYGAPVNILLIGSDAKFNGESGLSDTLAIVNVNYDKKKVYIVSIPRDTRVRIPGQDTTKINTAYATGGAELAIDTVQSFTGADIHHYIEIDRHGFKQMVDSLGGIDITVKETINDRSKQFRMFIPKGRQRMNGDTALNYVRYRHGDSDFKRTERQQNFLMALADNAVRFRSLPRLPGLINAFARYTDTDMSNRQLFELAAFLRGVDKKRIETATIPGKTAMIDNLSYVIPDRLQMRQIFDAIDEGGSFKDLASSGRPDRPNRTSASSTIRVTILNGSGQAGLASQAGQKLSRIRWIRVVGLGNADRFGYRRTQITASDADQEKARNLRRLLFPGAQVTVGGESPGHVTVILGRDYLAFASEGR